MNLLSIKIFLLFTNRDENGELTGTLNNNNKLAETISSSNQMINNIYTYGSLESDKDSGVAIELNSLDTMGIIEIELFSIKVYSDREKSG